MNQKQPKKQKNQPAAATVAAKPGAGWQSRYPVLLFVGGFALLMGLFYIVWESQWFTNHIHPHILSVYSHLSSMMLNRFGQHTHVQGWQTIYSDKFSVNILRGCDAVEAMALFSSALLAFPAKWKPKLAGLAAGILFLFVLNVVRIVSLFLIGVYYPSAFEVMHVEVWQVIFIMLALTMWLLWLRYLALPVQPVRLPTTHPVLKFLALFVVFYSVLIAAYPVFRDASRNQLLNIGNHLLSSHGPTLDVAYFETTEDLDVEVHVRNIAQAQNTAGGNGNSFIYYKDTISSYTFAYVPGALLLALILASAVSMKRKLIACALGVLCLNILIWFKMYIQLVNVCMQNPSLGSGVPGFLPKGFIDWVYNNYVHSFTMILYLVVFVWLAVTFRKDDLKVFNPEPSKGKTQGNNLANNQGK